MFCFLQVFPVLNRFSDLKKKKYIKEKLLKGWQGKCRFDLFPVFNPPGDVLPGKSISHMRQFHSHHNLLSLAQPTASSTSRPHGRDHDRRGTLGSAPSFSLGGGSSGSCSSLSGSTESSIWVRQTPQEESKPSPAANFWDFFTGKGSGSETMV